MQVARHRTRNAPTRLQTPHPSTCALAYRSVQKFCDRKFDTWHWTDIQRGVKGTPYSTYDVRVRAVQAVIESGLSVPGVAKAYGTHRATLYRWLARYELEGGPAGLVRRPVSGRPRRLATRDPEDFLSIVLRPASDFGYETDFWTCRRLLQVVQSECNEQVSRWTLWRRLREAGLTYQKPERRYLEVDERARRKWVRNELPQIRETVEKYRAILYFEDEANISLTAFLGKTWAPRGQTPVRRVSGRRGGISAMSAISITKRGRLLFTLHDHRINSDDVIHFLKQMLRHHPGRHLVVVMDQARPHTSVKTKAFIASRERLHVFYLPPYSPDWNPDESVWHHLKKQELRDHKARTKEEMQSLAQDKLSQMSRNSRQLRGIFFRCCVAELLH